MNQQVIVVLGMHRSGTSALMGALHMLGVYLGSHLVPAQEGVNEKGFWEHADIVAIHDRLLQAMMRRWDDLCSLDDRWWEDTWVGPFRAELMQIIRRDFASVPLWGMKDPRLCRLLPLWLEMFAELGCQPSFVIITRHPCEVAQSLKRRDGFPEGKSYWLWLMHTLEATYWTRHTTRLCVTYDTLLQDWLTTLEQMSAELAITWPRAPSAVAAELGQFLNPDLRHYRQDPARHFEVPHLPELVQRTYEAMFQAGHASASQLEATLVPRRFEFQQMQQFIEPVLRHQARELHQTQQGFSESIRQLDAVNASFEKVGAGFSQAVERLAEREARLAELDKALAQTRNVLAAHEVALEHMQTELAKIHSHWLWPLIRRLVFKNEPEAP